MMIERVANPEKEIIFPFVEVDKSIVSQGFIKILNIQSSRQVYNLVNRCIMHNISYDDQKDQHYTANYKFRHLMPNSENYFSIKIQ